MSSPFVLRELVNSDVRRIAGRVTRFARTVTVVGAGLLSSAFAPPTPCVARSFCKCREAPPVAKALAGSSAVLFGRVVARRDTTVRDSMYGDVHVAFSRVKVERAWKGVRTPFVELRSVGSDCDIGFRVGQTYLIYAHDVDGMLSTSSCGRTIDGNRAARDLAQLGAPAWRPH